MKRIGLLLILLICSTSYGQLAKVVDKDGYVNVRKEGNANSEIRSKLDAGEIVFLFEVDEKAPNWSIIEMSKRNDVSGYVHNSRLKMLDTYTRIPLVSSSKQELKFSGNNVTVTVGIGTFDYTKNKTKFTKQKGSDFLETYNGQDMWGTDGTIPTAYYTSIKINQNGKEAVLPTKAYENMFNPSGKGYTDCYYDKSDNTIYLTADNSDGAGSYVVVWVFKDGKYQYNNAFIPF
ncbi:SH3 domain-containing protein [Myroides sp. N17-2]|uniref:SH3 domain-containing protein n=1 Tax=Myroides sp. N17-2 TaxID=2030799 RepID=UPI000EFAC8B1|nr:SH3 domain-containing protein [Myroides sp. N17-2]